MLNENQINMLPERIYQRLQKANTEYLTIAGNMIKEVGRLRPTDVQRLQRMYDYGSDLHRISLLLSEISGKNVQDIYEAFDIIAKDNYNFSKPFYEAKGIPFVPYEENEALQRYVKSSAKQTADEYINLTQHTAFAVFEPGGKSIAPVFAKNADKVATSLSDTYTELMDYAVTKVQTGMTDYRSAMREVLRGMANSGIRTVDYATGYSRRLDTAVRQNVLWGLKQCNQFAADLIGEEFGADGYEISYHSHPRPSHAPMGGRQYARGRARTVKGVYYPSFEKEAEPLLNDFGCLHFKFSILLGISRPAYSAEQLAELKTNDNRTFEFEGEERTMYDGTQLQRKIETKIRKQKDIANIAKAGGDDDLRREAQEKINLLASKYHQLSEVSGLPTKVERMQVSGFRRVKAESTPSGQAKYKAIVNRKKDEKQYKQFVGVLGAENMPKTIDEFQKIKYNNIEAWEDVKYYARHISEKPIECVKIDRELIKLEIKKGKCYPNDNVRAYILPDTESKKDPSHILKRMNERHITDDEVRSYKENSKFMFVQWGGKRRIYYSSNGISVISSNNDEWIYKTAWKKEDFDEDTLKILEVINRYG